MGRSDLFSRGKGCCSGMDCLIRTVHKVSLVFLGGMVMTSVFAPTYLWLLVFSLGNALWTAGVDVVRRDEWPKNFFWKHWWHFPILTIIEFVCSSSIFTVVWNIRSGFYPSTGFHDIRGVTLVMYDALFFSGFFAFFLIGIIWHFWQLGRR